jgi:hypothetical protein
LYVLSTAPGARSEDHPNGAVPQALYRSTDGSTWEPTALGQQPWILDLQARAGVLYALGTVPGHAETMTPRIGSSNDGGATWSQVELPTAAKPPAGATVPMSISSIHPSLAVGPHAMVATLETTYTFDAMALRTDAEKAADTWTDMTDAGVVVEGMSAGTGCQFRATPEGTAPPAASTDTTNTTNTTIDPNGSADPRSSCMKMQPIRTIPWSELGISGRSALTVHEAFVSTDGTKWHSVSSPLPEFGSVDVTATPNGFIATSTRYTSDGKVAAAGLARSTDGERWTSLDAEVGQISYAGVVGSRIVAIQGNNGYGVHVVTSDDGGDTWTAKDLGALVSGDNGDSLFLSGFATGPLGVAIAAEASGGTAPDSHAFLITSPDATTWTVTPLTTVAQATGTSMENASFVNWLAVGTDHIVVTATVIGADKLHQGMVTFVGTPQA